MSFVETSRYDGRLAEAFVYGPAALGAGVTAHYALPDPELRAYDHGVGTLHVEGVLKGHLASVVGEIAFPGRSPWPWFVIVWTDGTKEWSFEDYGPDWFTVRELDAGYLDHYGPSVVVERRGLFGRTVRQRRSGPPCRFEFAWLPPQQAAEMWSVLGLTDADF